MTTTDAPLDIERELEQHRPELTGYCYRMLASPFEAEDAVQETLLRAWRGASDFERRASVRTWLYRIATNVCIDMAAARERRALPMDLGPAREPVAANLATPEVPWVEPIPDALVAFTSSTDPEAVAIRRESVRLAMVTAMQRLPARQRATLLLREVLGLTAAEVATLLEMSEASVNSALQRARATLEASPTAFDRASARAATDADRDKLDRFASAFERYDMDELAGMLRDDALQSMPPYDLWLEGREDVLAWWFGPGAGCAGSRLVYAGTANGVPAYGQYKPREDGMGFDPWSLDLFELDEDGNLAAATFFLDTERLFPLFGLAPSLPDAGS
ncbi:MAG: polymerase subunit sigma-70 [Thermoleophilia bacterium]|nr:polymerase subunit sigma-70 [Thermoleophilia bacterium]